jgi:hypothetical protein
MSQQNNEQQTAAKTEAFEALGKHIELLSNILDVLRAFNEGEAAEKQAALDSLLRLSRKRHPVIEWRLYHHVFDMLALQAHQVMGHCTELGDQVEYAAWDRTHDIFLLIRDRL